MRLFIDKLKNGDTKFTKIVRIKNGFADLKKDLSNVDYKDIKLNVVFSMKKNTFSIFSKTDHIVEVCKLCSFCLFCCVL